MDKSKNESNLYDSTFSYEELIGMASDLDKGDVNHDYKVYQLVIFVFMKNSIEENVFRISTTHFLFSIHLRNKENRKIAL